MDGLPVEKGESIVQIEDSVKAVLKDNLGFSEETVNKEFDKAHRIGPKFYNRQQTIVKFRSHDFKSKVYNIRNSSTNSNIKIRPSLTKRREDFWRNVLKVLLVCLCFTLLSLIVTATSR